MADSHKAIPRLTLLLTMNTTVEDTDYQPTPNQDEVKARPILCKQRVKSSYDCNKTR